VVDPPPPPAIDAAAPVVVDAAVPEEPRYTVTDALADAKSGKLERIGIGDWPGNFSIKGCIYKNDRVFVVDVYCTYKEQPAFSVVIIAPQGEVRIYAEANDPISTITRKEYFTFYAESFVFDEPPPELATAQYDLVTSWQEKHGEAWRTNPELKACSTDMKECPDPTWLEPARAFIAAPTDDWTWIVNQLRNRAQHSGKYVEKKAPK
jgi:hypothetical protein